MTINPIIPIWLMLIISLLIIAFIINKHKKITKDVILRISLLIILFFINIRPMIITKELNSASDNNNIIFVIDTTLSMAAEDMSNNKTRIDQVKDDCKYIMEKFPNSKYSMITFNNGSKIKSKIDIPLTTDHTMINNSLDILQTINEMYANSSSLNAPQDNMLEVLKNAYNKNDNENILFFFSDGEITDNQKLESYSNIKKYVSNGAVLGYGTEKGGYMKYLDYDNKVRYITYYDKNYQEKKGISKINEDNLKQIANDIGIDYINMNKQSNIDKLLNEINNNTKTNINDENIEAYDDLYYILLIPFLIIIFYIYKQYKEEYSL